MNIATDTVWRKAPANGSVGWGGEKVVVAATPEFVIIRSEFVSKLSPHLNKEEAIARADFEREYVTKAEASRRIHEAANTILAAMRPKAVLGTPALVEAHSWGGYTYEASNGVRIRFTADGHYYIENKNGNPVSSFDAAWIARRAAEIGRSYQSRRYFNRYAY